MDDDGSRLTRWENRSEGPLFLLSLIFLSAYAAHVLDPGLPQAGHDALLSVIGATWACFAVDYVVRLRLSGGRFGPHYVAHHLLETVVLVLPLLRPLRAVHIYQVVQRRHEQPRLSLYGRVIAYAGMAALLLGFSGALAVYQQERYAPGATIRTFGDSVWWACETLTTVGYGDVTPVTAAGRWIAAFLMLMGLALLGAVTGSFSSWLYQAFAREGELPPGR
ncbi:potassium channel family protein [Streptomyces cocklensis]|jgi:voltage-gated potassium channel|uniref:Potassium voltage-gated channel subfamily KQT potassium channel, VIC family n=1 Tax=Actinacidiphila cocklensis TaxID=887465 RepID=A0A9W4DR15_9ACTN|nr:potassium channel family protein [Actinacidiphila cocklensis]MDD1058940.1 potassium channel family protein [Actinacidiphila cocklensis]WSX73536.1 potassium channel family protein [Streptomyces sp. NBC_00899]WSX80400.1 potassium channel family protein [Streptomyces sp. NBC_00899]CAG6394439.1 putative Potassium voltage-gated channel subfamily KQT; potassium channel, VIC family [Actinacidiphila cocklensis]